MSKRVLILHGWGGSDFPHWQAHLERDLKEEGYEVSFPALPNRDLPKYDEWMEFLKEEFDRFRPEIVVCHSLANTLWFKFVQNNEIEELEKLMLVAPVRKNCDIEELSSFFPYEPPKDLRAKEAIVAVSDNDPYMSITEAIELQSALNIGMKIMNNAGHINADSGFGKLDCALDWIKRVVE